MGTIIQTTDGRIVGIDPTLYQGDIDKINRENAYHNAKADKARAEIERKAAIARKNAPDESERRAAMVEGLRRFAKRATRNGDDVLAKQLNAHADEAAKALEIYERHGKKLKGKRPDPLGDAQKAAALELMKVLPTCFPTEKDGLLFAQKLPLVGALAEAGRQADEFAKTALARSKAESSFWAEVEKGGLLAVGGVDPDASVRQLVTAGLL